MTMNMANARKFLVDGNFRHLFIEELGWDTHHHSLSLEVNGTDWKLQAIAHKRGMVAYLCKVSAGQRLPEYNERRKIEHQVAKSAHEHLVIFTDANSTTQIWQWVKREAGKPTACREHAYHRSQPGDGLLQKLEAIACSLEEEATLVLPDVTGRVRAAFDVERVTKRFYDRFQNEHAAFLGFITGIAEVADREWYASVMLNRLMFVYFIQRKGFLDGDTDYLRHRLVQLSGEHGKDKFYSFYRYFLLRLFHEGLGGREHPPKLEKLLGRIPYLNGGLFDVHELERPERYGKDIQIPDEAFERIFLYFDQYQWHLDERPLRADNEINPDVLGYIFEKYINQRQMGAYYTKEDITEYISKNTVIPFLFDAARAKCKVAFENPGGPTVWDWLKVDPDRYIYKAVRHGVTWNHSAGHPNLGEPLGNPCVLPEDIVLGLEPSTLLQAVGEVGSVNDVETLRLRRDWNRPAPSTHALPTETWREVITRRQRYDEIRTKLAAGEVRDINDLITYNLDIRQFAQDVIENSEGPDLLRAFWHAIEKVTILDPTCGSGAFLFAALNILEPLYEACLERMEAFVADLDRLGQKHHPEKFSDFRKVLERVAAHPNRRYFILKSIILNNLYGVDIMEEAVEICKLRLFLKLAAQVEPDLSTKNLGIEPLPDVDFNIRAGNTLVGYATFNAVIKSAEGNMLRLQEIEELKVQAADLQQAFDAFRERQVEGDGSVPHGDKVELHRRLKALDDDLNRSLAGEYGIDESNIPNKKKLEVAYAKWLKSHHPFHWFVEFYGIMKAGGFDIIIGNPPYVELSKVGEYSFIGYKTIECGNLYPLCVERSSTLLSAGGSFSMIVPLSGFSTERMESYQDHVLNRYGRLYISYFSGDAHPSVMFNGVKYRLCIIVGAHRGVTTATVQTTDYLRWYADERPHLFAKLTYSECPFSNGFLRFAKLGSTLANRVVEKINNQKIVISLSLRDTGAGHINYHRSPVFWIRSMDFEPYFKSAVKDRSTDHLKDLYTESQLEASRIGALLNSSLFYYWFTVQGNCRNIAGPDITSFPIGNIKSPALSAITPIFNTLMDDLQAHSKRRVYNYKTSGRVEYDEFYPDESKPIIDDIDCVLASHYGFTEEELDFVINYDIKYRMGREVESEED